MPKRFKTFAVSGMGRSGTAFLAHVLNQSPTWTVEHEPTKPRQRLPLEEVQERFDRDRYGEVNSLLRAHINDLDVTKRAVILRNPRDIWLSIANKAPERKWKKKVLQLEQSLLLLNRAMMRGAFAIRFDRITTDSFYLRRIAVKLGVDDLPEELDMAPRNATKEKRFHSIDDFEISLRRQLVAATRNFIRQYKL